MDVCEGSVRGAAPRCARCEPHAPRREPVDRRRQPAPHPIRAQGVDRDEHDVGGTAGGAGGVARLHAASSEKHAMAPSRFTRKIIAEHQLPGTSYQLEAGNWKLATEISYSALIALSGSTRAARRAGR
jgi:hypothetical protein